MICFVINHFKEPPEQIQSVIDKIRQLYPSDTEIIKVDDSISHLKQPIFGGAWTHRYLSMALETKASHIIKIDPDTQVLAQAKELPLDDCIFCRVREVKMGDRMFRVPAGGALGFTRNIAVKIVDKKYFLESRYRDELRFGNYNDLMLMDIVWRNNLKMLDRPDFCCGRRPVFEGASFAHK